MAFLSKHVISWSAVMGWLRMSSVPSAKALSCSSSSTYIAHPKPYTTQRRTHTQASTRTTHRHTHTHAHTHTHTHTHIHTHWSGFTRGSHISSGRAGEETKHSLQYLPVSLNMYHALSSLDLLFFY